MTSWIDHIVRERMLAEAAIIECACEAALQLGDRGVFVRRNHEGTLVSAEPNRHVPYGEIYESSRAAAPCPGE